MKNICYFNGSFISEKDAHIGVRDIGLLRGYGIYEGMSTCNNKPFALSWHFERFSRSAQGLGLTIPVTEKELGNIIEKIHTEQGFKRTNIRIILTGGSAPNGIEFDPRTPTFYVLGTEYIPLAKEVFEKGAAVITHEHLRTYPEYKTTNYITAVMLQPKRNARGALEIIFVNQGKVLEASTSNFFLIKNGVFITAKDQILGGITRRLILEKLNDGLEIEVREVSIKELETADEAFVTGSYKGIVPVTKIDGIAVGNGAVGPLTKEIIKRYEAFRKSY